MTTRTVILCLILAAQSAFAQVPIGNIPPGEYRLDQDQFVKNANLIAQGTVTIKGTGRLYLQNDAELPSVTVSGITFSGVQLIPDRSNTSAMDANIIIDNNTFQDGAHIRWHNGLAGGRITNNTWIGEANADHYAIIGLNYNGLVVANNLLQDIRSGIHIDAVGSGNNLLVEQNVVDGYCGIAYEFQSAANNVIVQDNYATRPNAKYGDVHVGAFSCILSRSANIKILRNYSDSPNSIIPRYVFEIGGDNSLSSDNWINGGFDGFINNDREGTHSTTVTGNRMTNLGKVPPITADIQSNNGPGVLLSWNPNRERPGPNKRLGSTPPPTTVPTPPTTLPLLHITGGAIDLTTGAGTITVSK